MDPGIKVADEALAAGTVEPLVAALGKGVQAELRRLSAPPSRRIGYDGSEAGAGGFMGAKWLDLGLLVMRLGLGAMFAVVHGWPKLIGGPEKWAKIGTVMPDFGLSFAPAAWGFLAAVGEFGGGVALLLGAFWRPLTAMLAFTMAVATWKHLSGGDGWGTASHAFEACAVALGLFLSGPGAFAFRRGKG